jgi:hypothetical protein
MANAKLVNEKKYREIRHHRAIRRHTRYKNWQRHDNHAAHMYDRADYYGGYPAATSLFVKTVRRQR